MDPNDTTISLPTKDILPPSAPPNYLPLMEPLPPTVTVDLSYLAEQLDIICGMGLKHSLGQKK
jgi:hypothetical protein